MINVSIIIVSWNTKEILRDCLNSIKQNAGDVIYEIIVVDNASKDSSTEMVKKNFPQVKLIESKVNLGFAAANNVGIKAASGDFLLLLNSDTVVLDKAIEKTYSFIKEQSDVGAVGCKVLNSDNTLQYSCFRFPSLLNVILTLTCLRKVFPQNRFFGREHYSWWDYNEMREVEAISGCFMFIPRVTIKKIGMMDESYFMYAEEADLCWRIKRAELKILFFPDASIIHLGGQSTRQKKLEMYLSLERSIVKFIKRREGFIAGWLVAASFFVRALMRVFIWTLIIPFLDAKEATELKGCRNRVFKSIFIRLGLVKKETA